MCMFNFERKNIIYMKSDISPKREDGTARYVMLTKKENVFLNLFFFGMRFLAAADLFHNLGSVNCFFSSILRESFFHLLHLRATAA